jgi:cytochrome c peroxidase
VARSDHAIVWLACALGACEPGAGPIDASADAALDDPDPVFSAEERETLATLRYDSAPPPADPSNRFADDASARLFGQRLFFDRAFSGRLIDGDNDGGPSTLGRMGEAGRVSCADCHLPSSHFVDTRSPHRQISLAAQWTMRRTPTLLETAFVSFFNWDGRRDSLWSQAIGVMESEREFNSGRLFVAQQIYRLHREEYESIFGPFEAALDDPRFGALTAEEVGCQNARAEMCRGKPGDGAEYDALGEEDRAIVTRVVVNAAKALDAYMRQLRCGESRFDAWLDGDELALSRAEQRGAALFAGRAGCVECHSGPRLTDGRFHNVGLQPQIVATVFVDQDDRGAGEAIPLMIADELNTRGPYSDGERAPAPEISPALEGAFRTPTLRCIADQPSFMHTAHWPTLRHVVSFFDRGGDRYGYPGTNELRALGLSERERADLTAFLGSLQGPGADPTFLQAP